MRYLAFTKNAYLLGLMWRTHSFFTLITSIIYITVMYFLWKSIYGASDTLHGMSFNQTFTYLALASSIFVLFKTFVEWGMSREIITGAILVQLTKPVDFQFML